ncbi:hypothetical protein MRX58_12285 (plasmid) [Xylella fastidiosa subsp. pauca]|nr:phospholipase D-like domain-containing protein [Xylella fastidiosa]MDG5824303.1 hypothetical protein [Xylella fastidiosa subsp. pauca]
MKAIGQFKEIISMENMAPALVDKIFWYQEPIFQARANLPHPDVPDQSDLVNTIEPAPSPTLDFAGAIEEQALPTGATFEVGFSPKRNALEVVMSFVLGAKTELLVAAYSFTSKDIAFALTEAKARGIDVRVVVDHAQNTDDQGAIRPSIICRHRVSLFLGARTMRRCTTSSWWLMVCMCNSGALTTRLRQTYATPKQR